MDDELLSDFVVEANEHLGDIENQFLAIESSGENVDIDLVNEIFRGVHSIKGAAGFLGMTVVNDLAHSLENILNMMRNSELTPTSEIIDVMLRAADKLQGLINDIQNSNSVDVSGHIKALEAIASGQTSEPAEATQEAESVQEKGSTAPEPAKAVAPAADDAELSRQIEEAFAAKQTVEIKQTEETPPPEKPAAKPAETKAQATSEKKTAAPEANIRVAVSVLDKLMNLAGELVLSRNQLMQAITSPDQSGLDAIASRIDQVTSEVQESIMQTRMQPIGSVFGKFPRIVRDLSSKLGKQCNLNIEGKEVEVDKTIIEAIGDPLTHLVRNSIDHGIEDPADRQRANKPVCGTMNLRAFYQAGKVRIEIQDDGAGINPNKLKEKAVAKGVITSEQAEQMGDREALRLIFHPGFSMAAKVTDVSGRGVGMDVVRTNISKLGGTVDVESVVGEGTNIVITLPLTLAIIPSLIVQSKNDRFAIPQVNIAELVRLRPAEIESRVGRIKDSEVLRLRGDLVPLIRLEEVLGVTPLQETSEEEEKKPKQNTSNATNILVLDTGQQHFGIVVDALHDSEEIVVKPLGRHLKDCPCLSGATILGDGHVALILDVAGIAAHQQIGCIEEAANELNDKAAATNDDDSQYMLLFSNHESEHFAVSMDVVSRIDRIHAEQIDSLGGQELLQYRNTTMSLLRLEDHINAKAPASTERLYVVVFEVGGKEIGLVTSCLEDIRDVSTKIDTETFSERGVLGSMVLGEQTTRLIDLFDVAELAHPEWFADREAVVEENDLPPLILLAEDSGFFRKQVTAMFKERGYRVVDCEDGQIAWETLQTDQYEFDLVVTDIEMPNMDGFELAGRIKQSAEWRHLPVIALTSLAGAADMQRGIEVGIDDYQIKMDRDKLLNSLHNFTGTKAGNNTRALQTC
ncbi:MAG: hybrid sensor histidine kinase/response regulator [Planctomycetes bacterium]|nr:hybrid sensor histidine kinase/response regulator [Planctomycetota bacterium]